MKRSERQQLAEETVVIAGQGRYVMPSGRTVEIGEGVRRCLEGTKLFEPAGLKRLQNQVLTGPPGDSRCTVEVVNETTLAGITRLLAVSSAPVAALNFASAKNPGGGFLNGSQAQEESLARSSALYASLQRVPEFYARHRAAPTLLYSDAMILSPGCPVFRDDDGTLLEVPHEATFITSPAPNAGAAATNRPEELDAIPDVFRRRSEFVLALAAAHGYRRLVLGAWGCGVFRNDPAVVAAAFAGHLVGGLWANRFDHVAFSAFDTSAGQETFAAFLEAFS